MASSRPRSPRKSSMTTRTCTRKSAGPRADISSVAGEMCSRTRFHSGRENLMRKETAGITRANEGLDGIKWNILGQTYVPKHMTENSFSWHATFPPDTFVPPHSHPTQDEYLYILEGRFDFWLNGEETFATAGDLVRLPMGVPHGIFNKSGAAAKCLFWVSPTRKLYD